jgi:hypothetical protein
MASTQTKPSQGQAKGNLLAGKFTVEAYLFFLENLAKVHLREK